MMLLPIMNAWRLVFIWCIGWPTFYSHQSLCADNINWMLAHPSAHSSSLIRENFSDLKDVHASWPVDVISAQNLVDIVKS